MLSHGEDKPPSRRMKRYWKVAVLANIKDESKPKPEGVPPDAYADFDHIETIDSIRAAIETTKREVGLAALSAIASKTSGTGLAG